MTRTQTGSTLRRSNPMAADKASFSSGRRTANGGVHVDFFYYTQYQQGLSGIRVSGAVSGETFVAPGNVTGTDLTVNTAIGQLNHQNRANCAANEGDSGAPVFTVTPQGQIVAAGIQSGTTNDTTCFYTPVKVIIDRFGGAPMG